jgi:hypothetical protein
MNRDVLGRLALLGHMQILMQRLWTTQYDYVTIQDKNDGVNGVRT